MKMSIPRRVLTFILSLSVLAIFLLNFAAMIIITLSGAMSGTTVPFYVIAIPFVFVDMLSPHFEIYWLALLVIVISIVLIFILKDFIFWTKDMAKKELPKNSERFAVFTELIVLLISFTYLSYFISMAVTNSSQPFGNPTSGVPTNYLLLTLLHAPVWEEFVYRGILLGIPLYLISYRKKLPWYRAIVGGKFGINGVSITILIISAFFFGSAHLISWEPAKFPSAFVAGLVLGYLFLRYGIYMSIAGHFIIDFMGSYSYINSPFWGAMVVISSLIMIVWFAAGFPYYWYYLRDMFYIGGRKTDYYAQPFFNNPQYQNYYQQQYQNQQNYVLGYKIICPNCGYDQHRVLPDGRFQCLRCGTIFYYKK